MKVAEVGLPTPAFEIPASRAKRDRIAEDCGRFTGPSHWHSSSPFCDVTSQVLKRCALQHRSAFRWSDSILYSVANSEKTPAREGGGAVNWPALIQQSRDRIGSKYGHFESSEVPGAKRLHLPGASSYSPVLVCVDGSFNQVGSNLNHLNSQI